MLERLVVIDSTTGYSRLISDYYSVELLKDSAYIITYRNIINSYPYPIYNGTSDLLSPRR